MKSFLFSLFAVFLLSTAAFSTQAFEPGACKDDIQKYCKDAKVVGGELKECMKKHLHELSDPCKANLIDLWLEKKQSK